MVRLLVNILFVFLILRLLRPLFRRVSKRFQQIGAGGAGPEKADKTRTTHAVGPYDELTPYEIEDAEFEEIHSERD